MSSDKATERFSIEDPGAIAAPYQQAEQITDEKKSSVTHSLPLVQYLVPPKQVRSLVHELPNSPRQVTMEQYAAANMFKPVKRYFDNLVGLNVSDGRKEYHDSDRSQNLLLKTQDEFEAEIRALPKAMCIG